MKPLFPYEKKNFSSVKYQPIFHSNPNPNNSPNNNKFFICFLFLASYCIYNKIKN